MKVKRIIKRVVFPLIAIGLFGCKQPEVFDEPKISSTIVTPYVTSAYFQAKSNYPGEQYMKVWIGKDSNMSDGVCYEMTQEVESSFYVKVKGLAENTGYYCQIEAGNDNFAIKSEIMPFNTFEYGLFSVSEFQKVRFSKGNLQYQATTNTWRFAEHPWDFVGGVYSNDYYPPINEEYGNVYENGIKCSNNEISPYYSGWIDLFGWATSGYNHGAVCYQPWSTSNNCKDYYAYGFQQYNLYDMTGKADWGYNRISNDNSDNGKWRTLSIEEWVYVMSRGRRMANVNGVDGVILLPDFFSEEEPFAIIDSDDYSSNVISETEWTNTMEPFGAVFLPAAGTLDKYPRLNYEQACFYWSSTQDGDTAMVATPFFDYWYWDGRCNGNPVRLVQDIQ